MTHTNKKNLINVNNVNNASASLDTRRIMN